ncbi:5601_t:CDS:2, partial [Racocetra fulgida]
GIRSYSKPTDDQWLNSVASLIPFATIEEDLEEYYNYLGESYIIYKSEEDNLNTEITATSNNSIINDVSQHKLLKTRKTIKQSQSRSTKAKISSSKYQQSNLQQNQFYNTRENRLYNTQENRSYNTQEDHIYNSVEKPIPK